MRIEEFDAIDVARMRHVGPYQEVGLCFERLFAWATDADAKVGRVLTLSYDNPETVGQERLRSAACIEMDTAAQPPEGIVRESVEGGRHAVLTVRGPYDGIAEGYRHLFGVWLPESRETMDDRPCHGDLPQFARRYPTFRSCDPSLPAVAATARGLTTRSESREGPFVGRPACDAFVRRSPTAFGL